jgi:trimeric autotransporter adhesin
MRTHLLLLAVLQLAPLMKAQDWSLLGNPGTNPAVNFLGTTDNAPLVFRVNNVRSGFIDQTSMSTFFGFNAGVSSTGYSNTGIGSWALDENTTGGNNTAVGVLALTSNTTGSYNVALGPSALSANKAGSRAVAIGAYAMNYANGTSSAFNNLNVAIGYQSMHGSISLTANTGNRNAALGYQALYNYVTGNENTAVGAQSLLNVTTGSGNTGIGNLALSIVTTGSNNTAVGRSANVSSSVLTNATALGNTASVNASNKVRLGNTSITVVEGQVAYTNPSDARFKQAVREDVQGLSLILRLRPVSYTFDRLAFAKHIHEDTEGREDELLAASLMRTVGFLAQEVEKTVEELRYPAFDAVHAPENPTDNYGLAYAQFVVPLVKAVQELHAENDALRERIEQLERRMDPLGAPGLQAYPVPADDAINVVVDAASAGVPATLEFFDASGRQVHQFTTGALPALLTVPLPGELVVGTYLLILRAEGQTPKAARVVVKR